MPIQFTENPQRNRSISFSASSRVIAGAGLREATQTEAEAGTVSGRYMSPLRVAQALDGGELSAALTTLSASGAVTFTAGTASSSSATGTLVVTGGVGISGTLYTGGPFYTQSGAVGMGIVASGVYGDATNVALRAGSSGTLFFQTASAAADLGDWTTTRLRIPITTASTSTTTGALVVSGGVGIGGKVNLNNGQSGSTASPVPSLSFGAYYDGTGAVSVSHIDLYSGTYGFGVAGGKLVYSVATAGVHAFYTEADLSNPGVTIGAYNTASTSTTTGALVVGGVQVWRGRSMRAA